MNAFKNMLLIGLALMLSHAIHAQVKLKLSLMADQQSYVVSMIPESTWAAPLNRVGSAQVVLRMQAGRPFLAGNVTSLIPGVSWVDNAYIESPESAPGFKFVCFALNEQGTKNIPFQAGVETPLFTFSNLEPGCVGAVELVENYDRLIQKVVHKDRINITQNIAALGARGNAFSGIEGGAADCALVQSSQEQSIVKNLRVYPVPTTDALQISWENEFGQEADKLLVAGLLGHQMALEKIIPVAGKQEISLDVSAFPTGLYTASLINAAGKRQFFQFIVTRL
ncbi:MAG: hypothetical protein KDD02_23985 [Phaeodactylibacter sp.]|nr:hypothetical protein [Phaeodactylibacter sp.]